MRDKDTVWTTPSCAVGKRGHLANNLPYVNVDTLKMTTKKQYVHNISIVEMWFFKEIYMISKLYLPLNTK